MDRKISKQQVAWTPERRAAARKKIAETRAKGLIGVAGIHGGYKRSAEYLAKQRAAWTPERRAAASRLMKKLHAEGHPGVHRVGIKRSLELIAKIAKSNTGQKRSLKQRQRMRAAWTEERRAAVSRAVKQQWTPERRESQRQQMLGRRLNEATKAKMRKTHNTKRMKLIHTKIATKMWKNGVLHANQGRDQPRSAQAKQNMRRGWADKKPLEQLRTDIKTMTVAQMGDEIQRLLIKAQKEDY